MSENLKALIIGADSSIIPDLLVSFNQLSFEIHGTSKRPFEHHTNLSKRYQLDLSSLQSFQEAFSVITREKFDVIISAVGMTSGVALEKDTPEHIEYAVRVNLTSQLWMLSCLVDSIKEDGVIIFFGSSAAEGESFDVTYSACKAGLRAAVSSYSKTRDLGEKRIYVVEPSLIEESTMYGQMTEENIAIHKRKWNGLLLKKSEVSKFIVGLVLDKKQKSPIQKLRPEERT